MVFGEMGKSLVQRVQAGGGEDASLAHGAAEAPAGTDGTAHRLGGAGEQAADRAAEALGEGDGDDVEGGGEVGWGCLRGNGRVEQPGAVEIGGAAAFTGRRTDGDHLRLRKDDAAAAVMGVLKADQGGRREDDMTVRLEGGAKILGGEQTSLPGHRELHAGIGARRAGLVPGDMGFGADDHLVAGAGEELQGDLIGHRAGGDEQRRLLAEQFGDAGLQAVDRGVLAILVIAHGGGGHGGPHGIGREGDRVRAKIDPLHRVTCCRGRDYRADLPRRVRRSWNLRSRRSPMPSLGAMMPGRS